MARSFGRHVTNYAWAEMAASLAGLLSFPILTRLLSVSDYGTLSLVATVLGVTVALGKLGVQHAALRGWSDVAAGRGPATPHVFESTVLWGMVASGGIVAVAWAALAAVLPAAWWGGDAAALVMLIAAPLVLVRVADSALVNQLRAREDSATMALYGVLRRYAGLVAVVAGLWWIARDLQVFFWLTLAVEAVAVIALLAWMYRGPGVAWPSPRAVSAPLYGALAAFGLPMLGSELATLVLTMGDRFVLQSLVGADALGVYAASYNLCDQLRNALLGAMVGAAYPRCLQLWTREGPQGLKAFLGRFLHVYVVVAAGMVALLAAAGGDLMAVLASERYRSGGGVTGWIMAGLAVQSALSVLAVGLYLSRRTLLAMVLVLAAGGLSLLGNLWCVPWLGIRGAAIVLLASMLFLAAAQALAARREAPVVWPWGSLARCGAWAALVAWAALQLPIETAWLALLLRGTLVVLAYAGGVLALDAALRRAVWQRVKARIGA